ncbi:Calreticulin family-domain-containing protein [Lipomyces arxii]|uniref:Calreticulin family-domain-containing protein n=1 Tax=Lipomyces arxii TaxID=56418 RepID=UPI0034CD0286
MRGILNYSLYAFALSLAIKGSNGQAFEDFEEAITGASETVAAPANPSASAIQHPMFTPFEGATAAVMFEQFTIGWRDRWKASNAKKMSSDGKEDYFYLGRWGVEEAKNPAFSWDAALVVKDRAAHHAISSSFTAPLDNKDSTLVVQYEVKLQSGLECGGAYLKLLTESPELHSDEFSDETSYQVMFGPDKCGSTNKVHFIVRRKSPISGEYEEKHLIGGPRSVSNKLTNLYTLIISPDQTYEIRINGNVASAGSLIEGHNFEPEFSPPAEIDDPSDTKPVDWVDEDTIPDPEQATKPEDWDEDAPFSIPDPDAVKPEDWDETAEEFIPDPDSEKPDDWDDEEDGEWVAPVIPNPECDDHGCGPWSAPTVPNPNYKGKWVQPRIPNPEYKGLWKPRTIPNPDYYNDSRPSDLEPIGAIGFELWTMQSDILFDNIYVGHSIADAEAIGNATFIPKAAIEKAMEDAAAPKVDEPPQELTVMERFRMDPVGVGIEQIKLFWLTFQRDPIFAIRNYPEAGSLIGVGLVTVFALIFALFAALFGKPEPPKRTPNFATKKVEDKTVEVVTESAGSSDATASETTATKRK